MRNADLYQKSVLDHDARFAPWNLTVTRKYQSLQRLCTGRKMHLTVPTGCESMDFSSRKKTKIHNSSRSGLNVRNGRRYCFNVCFGAINF